MIQIPAKGNTVSFQLVRNDINGGSRELVKVDAADVGYSTAIRIEPELNVKHANLYPFFKDKVGNVDDPSLYNYLILQGRNGALEVVGIPWILDSTFRIVAAQRATWVCENYRPEWKGPSATFFASLGAAVVLTVEDK